MNIYSIYRIFNKINNKKYIGWTSRNPEVRFKEHTTKWSSKTQEQSLISFAIKKYGVNNFTFEVIYQSIDYDHSRNAESNFIVENNSLTASLGGWGYNIDLGGTGHKRSIETIEKHRIKISGKSQSELHKKNKANAIRGEKNGMYGVTGEAHPRYGKSLSIDEKNRIGKSQKKRIAKQKLDGTYIKPLMNDDIKKKISATKKNKNKSGQSLKYKNIIIMNSVGDMIQVPVYYIEYFKTMKLNNFMSKSVKKPGVSIKGFTLVSYELNK